ncbi:pyridine nucleotide-disulfide oxidoreductase [Nocardia panacis]|uniref:Pyridine nucleotide-disulfide oxidoreductase n=1 Tax=Nocardia panacis TaxID=2340916 RepID=A0A3A4K7T6_9NOCA|nr:FAD-dependent oxidoreductase [Nocardia panacis]RJO70757.1 pyridine nucleotide-disulfide oxidoreductase [Nocardia panacis]
MSANRTAAPMVIVGAGHAGVQVASSLRERGFADPIVLIDAQARTPYQRPPLSKEYLNGAAPDPAPLRHRQFYDSNNIQLRPVQATRIDPHARIVGLDSGEQLEYRYLVLATGAGNRVLDVPGADAPRVRYLRTLDDARALRENLATATDIVVIGAGFIGLEAAAAARKSGCRVRVVDTADRVMARAVSPATSSRMMRVHSREGVIFHLGRSVRELLGTGPLKVRLDDGTTLPADLVIVGVGVTPATQLAQDAGLTIENGVSVNEFLQTSDPDIFAIGDCASFPDPRATTRTRLESVQNAVDQGKFVAGHILGDRAAYHALPWFWTHQYSTKLQIAGHLSRSDESLQLGEPEAFSILHFQAGSLVAVESFNRPGDHVAARRILAGAEAPTSAQARADGFSLKLYAQSMIAGGRPETQYQSAGSAPRIDADGVQAR